MQQAAPLPGELHHGSSSDGMKINTYVYLIRYVEHSGMGIPNLHNPKTRATKDPTSPEWCGIATVFSFIFQLDNIYY